MSLMNEHYKVLKLVIFGTIFEKNSAYKNKIYCHYNTMKANKRLQSIFAFAFFIFSAINGMAQTQIGTDIDAESTNDRSGWSISMGNDTTVAIGAILNDGGGSNSGHVRIYDYNGAAWVQRGSDINGESSNDNSGYSVSMPHGNFVGIGAYRNDDNGGNSGHVRVYKWNGSTWTQRGGDIDGEAIGDESGSTIIMPDTNTVAIGARNNDGNGSNSGHARVYRWNGSDWVQKGIDLDRFAADYEFGTAVSMADSNTLAVSSVGNIFEPGEVYIYDWNGTAWIQRGATIVGESSFDLSGISLSMPSPNYVAIGAANNAGNGSQSGHVRIYNWNGANWVQVGSDLDGEAANNRFGASVSMPDSITLAVGANWNNEVGNMAGHTRIFEWDGVNWNQKGIDIDGEAADDQSGYSVDMPSNKVVAIGALFNAGTGFGAGHTRVYSLCESNSVDLISACDSYTWIDGNTYTSSSNTATHVIPNAAGCDSTITLDLTINSVSDLSTSVSGITISANNTNATYVWLDCDDNFAMINGETNQSFIPTANGNYAIELTENGCVDTTACVAITTIGVLELTIGKEFVLMPNPSSGLFEIELVATFGNVSVAITDVHGSIVTELSANATDSVQVEVKQPAGVYFVQVIADDQSQVLQLIIK